VLAICCACSSLLPANSSYRFAVGLKPGPTHFNVGGESLAEACRRAEVNYKSVIGRVRYGITPIQAIAWAERRKRLGITGTTGTGGLHMINGIKLSILCRPAGVKYVSVWSRMKIKGETPAQALAHYVKMAK
jgi:hypothetical protein